MTTEEILQLDCTEYENEQIIQKALKKIPPLAKCSESSPVPFWAVEKALTISLKKYRNITLRMIMADINSNDDHAIWAMAIAVGSTSKPKWIYGITLYEVFAKSMIYVYTQIKKQKVE